MSQQHVESGDSVSFTKVEWTLEDELGYVEFDRTERLRYKKKILFDDYVIDMASVDLNIYARIFKNNRLVVDYFYTSRQIDLDESQIEIYCSNSSDPTYYIVFATIDEMDGIMNFFRLNESGVKNLGFFYTGDEVREETLMSTYAKVRTKWVFSLYEKQGGFVYYCQFPGGEILPYNIPFEVWFKEDPDKTRREIAFIKREFVSIQGNWQTTCVDSRDMGHIIILNQGSAYFDLFGKKLSTNPNSRTRVLVGWRKDNKEANTYYFDYRGVKWKNNLLDWSNFATNRIIAKMILIDGTNAFLTWYGFYNEKTKKREFLLSDFNAEVGAYPVRLHRCSDK